MQVMQSFFIPLAKNTMRGLLFHGEKNRNSFFGLNLEKSGGRPLNGRVFNGAPHIWELPRFYEINSGGGEVR
jgi:hypothetical protein